MGIVSSSLDEGEITPWLIAKLVSLNYQSRMGILQAGNYGNLFFFPLEIFFFFVNLINGRGAAEPMALFSDWRETHRDPPTVSSTHPCFPFGGSKDWTATYQMGALPDLFRKG